MNRIMNMVYLLMESAYSGGKSSMDLHFSIFYYAEDYSVFAKRYPFMCVSERDTEGNQFCMTRICVFTSRFISY